MIENNLFKHAQKELVIDAFLCWLFNEMNGNKDLQTLRDQFLFELLNLDSREIGAIHGMKAETQVDFIDLLVTLEKPEGEKYIVFENKMWSSEHSNQLERYKEKKPDALEYVYLKLGYVHKLDEEAANSAGYLIIKANQLYDLLNPFKGHHLFIGEFVEYLKSDFVDPQDNFENYVQDDEFEKLSNGSFQQYVMGRIMDNFENQGNIESDLEFRIGSNRGGSSWTQLKFSRKYNFYGDQHETLFFRIDKRSGKYYFRVNQYAKGASKFWDRKKKRLDKFRDVAKKAAEKVGLNPGKLSNRGKNESEVVVFFFEENNSLNAIIKKTPYLAKELIACHKKLHD